MTNTTQNQELPISKKQHREALSGILIAFFAALMALSQMLSNNLEEKMMIAHNKMASYSNWYQSKSIKQILKEGERDYLSTLLSTKMITDENQPEILNKLNNTKDLIIKYEAEKTELFVGSKNVPRSYWAQDLNGEMGKIIGVREWESITDQYEKATQKFDLGMLFFQISIVLGAIGIMLHRNPIMQNMFILLVIICGLLGAVIALYGYSLAP